MIGARGGSLGELWNADFAFRGRHYMSGLARMVVAVSKSAMVAFSFVAMVCMSVQ